MRISDKELRKIFEYEYKPVSDSTWYRLNKIFDKEFPKNIENIKFIAQLKKSVPFSNQEIIKKITEIKNLKKRIKQNNMKIQGIDLINELMKYEIKIPKQTFYSWFSPLGGFSRNRIYSLSEIIPIIMKAYRYNCRKISFKNNNFKEE